MCGLFGYSGRQPVDLTKLRWLAVENESRGHHSTGIFTIKQNKEETTTLFKDVGTAKIVMNRDGFMDALTGAVTVQGHTRAATVGSVTKENAHPFLYDFSESNGTLVVGAHNGFVLDKHRDTPQHLKFGFEKPFEVDSMLIFAALAKTGDMNILPTIEGGIACSFQMPNKYKNILFLYQASGRSLYFGYAKEGLYYSSEDDPLKLINCKLITQVPYNSLVVIDEGTVVDIMPMPKPEINVKIGAKRDTWHEGLSREELKELGLEDLAEKQSSMYFHKGSQNSYTKKNNGAQCNLPASIAKGSSIPMSGSNTTTTAFKDTLGLLVEDVKRTIEAIVEEPLAFSKTTSYGNQDTDSCLVLIKLIGSVHKQPLPAWIIFDKDDQTNAGVTALNGITILKFDRSKCDQKRNLVLSCPASMDNPDVFKVEITPTIARVMEVTLELPFPSSSKKQQKAKTDDENSIGDVSYEKLTGLGSTQLSLYVSRPDEGGCVLPTAGDLSKQVHMAAVLTRHQGTQDSTQEKVTTHEDIDGVGEYPDFVRQGAYMASKSTGTSEKLSNPLNVIPPKNNRETLRLIIDEENKQFKNRDAIRRVLLSQEYGYAAAVWEEVFDGKLNVKRVLGDSAAVLVHDLNRFNCKRRLSDYAWNLVVNFTQDYTLKKEITEEEEKEIFKGLGTITNLINGGISSSEVGERKKHKKEWTRVSIID